MVPCPRRGRSTARRGSRPQRLRFPGGRGGAAHARPAGLRFQMPGPGKWQRKFRSPEFPISRGSFSSVSTLLIARVGAIFSILRDLQDCYTFAPLQCNFLRYLSSFFLNVRIFAKFCGFFSKSSIFRRKFHGILPELPEMTENCWKSVNCAEKCRIFSGEKGKRRVWGKGKSRSNAGKREMAELQI